MIPIPDAATGLLPPGRHRAGWDEIEEMFVRQAPYSSARRLLFLRLRDWADQCWSILPKAELWIDGSFVRYSADQAPFDVDVVAFAELEDFGAVWARVRDELKLAEEDARLGGEPRKCPFAMQFLSLWTMKKVRTDRVSAPRIQPFGSSVDGFLTPKQTSAQYSWDRSWSGLAAGGPEKGYLEVIPSA
ncbi:MAG: hypothetical protein REI45_10205 [Propionicimonas sp.]|nr:hypothetical protein [Propionicimonas sp.]